MKEAEIGEKIRTILEIFAVKKKFNCTMNQAETGKSE